MDFNIKDLPPEKKKVLAIGGGAFVVLIFISLLLALMEDSPPESAMPNEQGQVQQGGIDPNAQGQAGNSLPLPSSQRYDYAQGQGGQSGQGRPNLESLLQDGNQVGVENDPFANMNSDRSQQGQGAQGAYGPAPIPTEDDYAREEQLSSAQPSQATGTKGYLRCPGYRSEAEANSQKATLAFQGVMSQVRSEGNGTYALHLGPFKDMDEARTQFYNLSNKKLLKDCYLYQGQ